MSEENIDNELADIETSVEKGDNEYGREFKRVYKTVRKSLVVLSKNRKTLGNKRVVEKTKELLEKVLTSLE